MTSRGLFLLLFFSIYHASAEECDVEFVAKDRLLGKLVVESRLNCPEFYVRGTNLVNDLKGHFETHYTESKMYKNSWTFKWLGDVNIRQLQLPLINNQQQLTFTHSWAIQQFLRLWMKQLWELKVPQRKTSKSSNSHTSVVFETTADSAVKLYSAMNRKMVNVSPSVQRHHRSYSSALMSSRGQLLVLPNAFTNADKANGQSSSRSLPSSVSSMKSLITSQSVSRPSCKVEFVVGELVLADLILLSEKGDCSMFRSTESFREQMRLFEPTEKNVYARGGNVQGVGFVPLAVKLYYSQTVTLIDKVLISLLVETLVIPDWEFSRADNNIVRLDSCSKKFSSFFDSFVGQLTPFESKENAIEEELKDRTPDEYTELTIQSKGNSVFAYFKKVNYYPPSAYFNHVNSYLPINFWKDLPEHLVSEVRIGSSKFHYYSIPVDKWNELEFLKDLTYFRQGETDVFSRSLHSDYGLSSADKVRIEPLKLPKSQSLHSLRSDKVARPH